MGAEDDEVGLHFSFGEVRRDQGPHPGPFCNRRTSRREPGDRCPVRHWPQGMRRRRRRAQDLREQRDQESRRATAARIPVPASCRSASRVAASADSLVSTTKHGWGSRVVRGSYPGKKESRRAWVASETDGVSRRSASRLFTHADGTARANSQSLLKAHKERPRPRSAPKHEALGGLTQGQLCLI
jgi:hypothetical protein